MKIKLSTGNIGATPDVKQKIKSTFDTLSSFKEKGRLLSEIFLELPDKNDYPDYYMVIKKPVAFDTVEAKLSEYKTINAFHEDMKTMFNNAMTYNQLGSRVYKDAQTLLIMLDNILGIDSGMDASKPAAPVSAATTIDYKSVWKSISTHDDEDGRIVSELFQELPDADEYPDYYEEIKQPIALDSIKKKISKNEYHDLAAFEADFNLMFSNAKQYNAEGSSVYTDAVTLQNLFFQLIGKSEASLSSPLPLDLTMVDEVRHKGETYAPGDYVYVINPLSPSIPTILQISDVWIENSGEKNSGVTGCWFLRPEQTVHKATQKFMENEVFKTNHMENYKCHEIVGRAIVLFFKEYIRGKPKGFDMKDVFVCESRYNEVGKSFSRIKMWNACLPEKAKNIDVELDLYDTPLNPARMHSSLVKEEPAASRKRKLSDDGSLEDISKKKMAPPSSTSFAAPPQSVPKKAQKTSGSTSNYIPYQNTPAKTNQQTWIPGGASKTPVQTSPWAVANSTSSLSANSVQPIVNAEPLPTETIEHFDTTPDNRIKWFSAPPLSIVATKEPAIHTLEYLVKKKELEELARQELKSQPLGIKKTVRHTPKSTIVTEKNVDPIFAELVKGASASTGTASDTKLSAFTDVLTALSLAFHQDAGAARKYFH